MIGSQSSAIVVKLAVAAFDANTSFWSPDIPNAGDTVRIVVLEDSFGSIDNSNTTEIQKTNKWINDMRAVGQLVFGYVACNSGEADVTTVKAGGAGGGTSGIDTWYERFPQIDGIYLDQGPQYEASYVSSNNKTIQENYTEYSKAIRGNGWRVMMEASAYPFNWILDIAEFILLWDGSVDDYENKYNGYLQGRPKTCQQQPPPEWCGKPPDWWCSIPDFGTTTGTERIVHTIWNYTPGDPHNPSDIAVITDVLTKARGRCAGSVYMTNNKDGKVLGLPPYFQQEVQAVQGGA
jgi:hypothetical protein